ncbi:MAG: maleylpyruvate isomerase N-terminal domain-containing protein [Acidimicrobiales bacterium]
MNGLHLDTLGTDVIRRHSHGLADVANAASLADSVPTCGDWTMADLVWHMIEVQTFWRYILGGRPDARPQTYEEPERLPDVALASALRSGVDDLVHILDGADPGEAAWSWSSDHTVGFSIRRQSHEALIHHVDGLLAANAPLPVVAPRLAADGVDELINLFIGDLPDWAAWHPGDHTVSLVARDTTDRWGFRLGRMTGTSPKSGKTYDLVAAEPVPDVEDATLALGGAAIDLLLWLWGRGDLGALARSGDVAVAGTVREMLTNATQ